MHTIQIDASPHQLRKLKKGHRVRVKKGEGFELLVHPHTYNIVSRSFVKNKGSEIQLTPEEIEMNKGILKAISPEAHNPTVQKAAVPAVGASPIAGGSLRNTSSQIQLADALNKHLGSNYGYLARAGLDNAINGNKSAAMARMGIDARFNNAPKQSLLGLVGPHSRVTGGALVEKSTIGLKGSMIHSYTPPALVSQPFSANFQFQHFLPPQYQHFNSGGTFDNMNGSGLYV